jgi:indolepyruvate ferredoxin oxidoreductase beta subunit
MRQQIVISGVGGQGVLFVTRLLAEAAINKGFSVFTSETHGMAQRGGTVLSHLKVGNFSSPLIRPSKANGLLALKAESLVQHGSYLESDAWAVVNSSKGVAAEFDWSVFTVDADKLAQDIKNPKSVNLVLLGFAMAVISASFNNKLFCSLADIKSVLENKLADKQEMLYASIEAIQAGYNMF